MMSFPRPDDLPEWATTNYTDPVSLVVNKVEPPLEKKQKGWFVREAPPSNWFNYWQNLVYQWIGYLDEQTTDLSDEFQFTPTDISSSFTLPTMTGATILKTGHFIKMGKIGFISIRAVWTNNLLTPPGTALTIGNLPFASASNGNEWGLNLVCGGSQISPVGAGLIPNAFVNAGANTIRFNLFNPDTAPVASIFAVGGSVPAGSLALIDLGSYAVGSFDLTGWYELA
jgi:hypothetical protein